ncbi:MAG: tetratricopeptide repeat protein [Opitutales bacterium]
MTCFPSRRHCVLLVTLATLAAAPSASAFNWWPFGTRASDLPAAEQTALAEPLYEAAREDVAADRLGAATRHYKRIYKKYPGSDYADKALFEYGEIMFDRRKWKQSFGAFQTLLQLHPDFPNFDAVVHYQFRIGLRAAAGDNMRLLGVIPFRAWERAVVYFEVLIQNAPYSDLAPLALMNVAQIHQYLGNTAQAVDALDRLINFYPESVLADDAYLELGHTFAELNDGALYDQGSTREAQSYYEDFLVLFPSHPKVEEGEEGLSDMRNAYAESKLVIGEYYYRHRNWYLAAEIFFNEAITLAPESEAADRARRYLVRIDEFKQLTENDPDYRPPSTTWAERLFFWRARRSDLTDADAKASAAAIEEDAEDSNAGRQALGGEE